MSSRRILVVEHAKLSATMEALRRFSGDEGPYTMVVGKDVAITDSTMTLKIPGDVIVDYKLAPVERIAAKFDGPRRSKGDRKRNKSTRWS